MSRVYISPDFKTGKDVDNALNLALTAVQEAPKDGKQWARSDGKWVLAGVGSPGKNAYEVAIEKGIINAATTVEEWLKLLEGDSAYTIAKKIGAIGLNVTERQWLDSLKGRDGANLAILKTYYFKAGPANNIENFLNSSTADIFGSNLVLDQTKHSRDSLLITLNGVLIVPGLPTDTERDWTLDFVNNRIIFHKPLQDDDIVTITDLTASVIPIPQPAVISTPGTGVTPPPVNQRPFNNIYSWDYTNQAPIWRDGRASLISVGTQVERFALTDGDLKVGTIVYQADNNKLYSYIGDPALTPRDSTNWRPVEARGQVVYIGSGSMTTPYDATNNWGFPAGTLPDPMTIEPLPNDIYINTLIGSAQVLT